MQSVLFSAAPITSVDIENTGIKRITIKKQYNSFKCNIDVAKTVSDTWTMCCCGQHNNHYISETIKRL